jgi:two-component system NtrC family sensor kinase
VDVRERLFLQLTRYYRYSAIGQQCIGIVHNFNTPLQVLSLDCELLERKAAEEKARIAVQLSPKLRSEWEKFSQYRDDKLRQFKEGIEALYRLTRLIIHRGMHEDQQDQQILDLNDIIRDELELFQTQRFFKHQVDKRFQFEAGLPLINGFYIDFSQSFRNLVDNALEAMETVEWPVLTIETAREEKRRIIRVGDNGVGIAPEIQPRIFEPFFTTKDTPEHPRAGLGLFMARRLLAPYMGEIRIESRPGETWVTVILP